jgi:nucleoside 2-deoxyribosyltransferase
MFPPFCHLGLVLLERTFAQNSAGRVEMIETSKDGGLLDLACLYLSGPMEYVADHGVEWRRKFIKLAKEAKLRLDIIDPTNKPGGDQMRIGEDKGHQTKLKTDGRWRELRDYVRKYRRFDLRFVDISDLLIAVVDPRVPQWGTSNEIYFAEAQHKPMFFIIDGGLKNLPNWLFDVVELDDAVKGTRCNVFQSVEEVVNELVLLNHGQIPMNDKWVLVRKHLEHARSQNPN